MRREECLELFKRIPESMHPQVNLALRNGFVLSIETIARFESTYLVFRGREGGTSDEGRAFFVPYDEICYIRIERAVRLGELKKMYGEEGFVDAEDRLTDPSTIPEVAPTPVAKPTPPAPSPTIGTDPASIAKQNILDRIRAARANVAGITGKLGGSK